MNVPKYCKKTKLYFNDNAVNDSESTFKVATQDLYVAIWEPMFKTISVKILLLTLPLNFKRHIGLKRLTKIFER